jgi:hypothetical protein
MASLFSVVTWGCAASHWLARALNSHPDIFSVHALNLTWATATGTPRIDGAKYVQALASLAPDYRAVGDVHGIGKEAVYEIKTKFRDRFRCAVLIRDPMARFRSALALYAISGHTRGWGDLSHLTDLVKSVPIPEDTYENRLAIQGMTLLNSIGIERTLGPVVRQEDVTSDPVALQQLVFDLTDIEADLEWALETVKRPAAQAHSSTARVEIRDWHREALKKIVTPQSWALYEEYGYPKPYFL